MNNISPSSFVLSLNSGIVVFLRDLSSTRISLPLPHRMDIKFEKKRGYSIYFEKKRLPFFPLSGNNLKQLFRYAEEYIVRRAVIIMRYRDTGTTYEGPLLF